MELNDFIYEEINECDIIFDYYIIYMENECDDPYYPPYTTDIGVFKSKDKAIQYARESFNKIAKDYSTSDDRKYGGVESKFYIEGKYFEDSERKIKNNSNKPVYVIYDKEEQTKINARWNKMHGK